MPETKRPIERLEDLLPAFKEKLLPADYLTVKSVCLFVRDHRDPAEVARVTQSYTKYLDGVASSHQHYLNNPESMRLLNTAIRCIREL